MTEQRTSLQVTGVILTYWTISITMVFCNKFLLGSGKGYHDVSLFIAWFQCVSTVVSVIVGTYLRGGVEAIPPLSRSILMSKNLAALSFLFTGMLTFNNLCLKHVGVAFFQIARSLTLIFTVILSALILKRTTSCRVIFCCCFVACGFFLGVDQESISGTLSIQGVVYGITTSMLVALVGIFTKLSLETVSKDVVLLTYYNNFNAMILFIPLCALTNQFNTVITEHATDVEFWAILSASGLLSFLIGWASNKQIDYTSPVTHHISNNTKSVLQTVIAVLNGGYFKPWLWWMSMAMVVTGAFLYAVVKLKEAEIERSVALRASRLQTAEEPKNLV